MLHLVVPAGVGDPARPSGGNRYDLRVAAELRSAGHEVAEHHAGDLGAVLAAVADGEVVLVDGLVACAQPDAFVAATHRLSLGVLLHMVTGDHAQRLVLGAARVVITTSEWGRRQVIERHAVPPGRVRVAVPGADLAATAPGTADGGALLCVAAVAVHKGQDVLLRALAALADSPWRLVCAGSLVRDPHFVARLREQAAGDGVADRISFAGALSPAALDQAYREADLLVHPSHGETYGLVITEALAHGLPVVASEVGGVVEALGARDAGVLVPAGDPGALASALREWLTSPARRAALRRGALGRRATLPTWAATARAVASALLG